MERLTDKLKEEQSNKQTDQETQRLRKRLTTDSEGNIHRQQTEGIINRRIEGKLKDRLKNGQCDRL